MGLIKCPECGKEISDKAEICVNCGFPIKNFLTENESPDNEQVAKSEIDNSANIPQEESNQNVVFCRVCGERNNADDNYCKSCASRLYKSNFEMAFDDIGNKDKKDSAMSIASFILSIFGCMCYIGLIFAIIDLIAGKRERKHRFSIIAILLCIVWTIVFIFIGGTESDETYSEPSTQIEYETETELETTTEETDKLEETQSTELKEDPTSETEKKEEPKKHNKVVTSFINDGLDEKVAVKAYNILKKKIGFKKIRYDKKVDGVDMYYVNADGYDVAITASDKVYSVFVPESDYLFYEDGKVKLTAKRLGEITYDSSEASHYYIMAQEIVKDSLKNPSGAKFPSQVFSSEDIAIAKDGDLVAVKSYVDATNGFGAKVRNEWVVQFTVVDLDNFLCDPNYIKIGDDSAGEYKKMKSK